MSAPLLRISVCGEGMCLFQVVGVVGMGVPARIFEIVVGYLLVYLARLGGIDHLYELGRGTAPKFIRTDFSA